jgi:hypothetical protein
MAGLGEPDRHGGRGWGLSLAECWSSPSRKTLELPSINPAAAALVDGLVIQFHIGLDA